MKFLKNFVLIFRGMLVRGLWKITKLNIFTLVA